MRYDLIRHYAEYGRDEIAAPTPLSFASKPQALAYIHERIAYTSHSDISEIAAPDPIRWTRNYWLVQMTANDVYHIVKLG